MDPITEFYFILISFLALVKTLGLHIVECIKRSFYVKKIRRHNARTKRYLWNMIFWVKSHESVSPRFPLYVFESDQVCPDYVDFGGIWTCLSLIIWQSKQAFYYLFLNLRSFGKILFFWIFVLFAVPLKSEKSFYALERIKTGRLSN